MNSTFFERFIMRGNNKQSAKTLRSVLFSDTQSEQNLQIFYELVGFKPAWRLVIKKVQFPHCFEDQKEHSPC